MLSERSGPLGPSNVSGDVRVLQDRTISSSLLLASAKTPPLHAPRSVARWLG
jgi:hypothetical protein